ncbi:hypothetical protein D9615_008820 [Tricholomella constricta]|uniref:Uncharacterized protein n=1 Tax=Tricholomella constricta TaxID=117010 RepID=A0A8H5GZU4_9AGAR|nr:hypothetical protein D9615_008820 [Tricholomella constricta]
MYGTVLLEYCLLLGVLRSSPYSLLEPMLYGIEISSYLQRSLPWVLSVSFSMAYMYPASDAMDHLGQKSRLMLPAAVRDFLPCLFGVRNGRLSTLRFGVADMMEEFSHSGSDTVRMGTTGNATGDVSETSTARCERGQDLEGGSDWNASASTSRIKLGGNQVPPV